MIKQSMLKLLSFGLFCFFASIVSLVLIITLGLSERLTVHLGFLLGLIITTFYRKILINLATKRNIGISALISEAFGFLILIELAMLILSPLHSLVPESILLKTGILKNIDEIKDCPFEEELAKARDFMKYDIDLSKVKIYYGGDADLFRYFNVLQREIKATAWGNIIYVSRGEPCIKDHHIVHELTHVWQYQHGYGFGIKWLYLWPYYCWNYFTDFDSLYDFGSYDGLIKAMSEGKEFKDFGLEQQARVVETYYFIGTTGRWGRYLDRLEEFRALKYFVSQGFGFDGRAAGQ